MEELLLISIQELSTRKDENKHISTLPIQNLSLRRTSLQAICNIVLDFVWDCDIHHCLCALGWCLPALRCLGHKCWSPAPFLLTWFGKKRGERAGGTRRRISVFCISEEENLLWNIHEGIAKKHGEGGTKREVKWSWCRCFARNSPSYVYKANVLLKFCLFVHSELTHFSYCWCPMVFRKMNIFKGCIFC